MGHVRFLVRNHLVNNWAEKKRNKNDKSRCICPSHACTMYFHFYVILHYISLFGFSLQLLPVEEIKQNLFLIAKKLFFIFSYMANIVKFIAIENILLKCTNIFYIFPVNNIHFVQQHCWYYNLPIKTMFQYNSLCDRLFIDIQTYDSRAWKNWVSWTEKISKSKQKWEKLNKWANEQKCTVSTEHCLLVQSTVQLTLVPSLMNYQILIPNKVYS